MRNARRLSLAALVLITLALPSVSPGVAPGAAAQFPENVSAPYDSAALLNSAGEWNALPGRDVAVLYHDDEPYAGRVLAISEERAPVIAASMGLRTISPLRIMVASSDEEFLQLTHYGVPDWGVGCALNGEGLVVLKSPRIVGYPLQMETVVAHELAHIAAGRVLRGIAVPRWFHEGVAQAVAGEWRASESVDLARGAAAGMLPELSELDVSFPTDRRSAAVAYAMSYQAVRLLMERSGARSPGQLVAAVSAARDFDSGVFALTGWTRAQFQEEYRNLLSRRFSIGTVLSDDRLLFAGLTLVFVAIVAIRSARTRARMRELEREELEEGARPTGEVRPPDSRWS